MTVGGSVGPSSDCYESSPGAVMQRIGVRVASLGRCRRNSGVAPSRDQQV